MQRKTVLKQMANDIIDDLTPVLKFLCITVPLGVAVSTFSEYQMLPSVVGTTWFGFMGVCFYQIGKIQYQTAARKIQQQQQEMITAIKNNDASCDSVS